MAVYCRLSTILGEQRLKVSDLERMSGISRTALQGLYHDKSTRIDFSVIDRLCKTLNCTVGDLLVYKPGEE